MQKSQIICLETLGSKSGYLFVCMGSVSTGAKKLSVADSIHFSSIFSFKY